MATKRQVAKRREAVAPTLSVQHKRTCRFRIAETCAVGVECEHGYDVCPMCDPCTCGATTKAPAARFSEVVDNITHYNLTPDEAIGFCVNEHKMSEADAREKVMRGINDDTIGLSLSALWPSDGLRRWRDAMETIEAMHGRKEREAVAALVAHDRSAAEASK